MTIRHLHNYLTEEATLHGDNIGESRAIRAIGGGDFMGANALDRARAAGEKARAWLARHPEASAYCRPQTIKSRPFNLLARELLRRGAHRSDVRHMVTH